MKTRIDDLYFGVMSYSQVEKKLMPVNLFDLGHIRFYAANYRLNGKDIGCDPLLYIFGDVWSRFEYELFITPNTNLMMGEKLDLFRLYVQPNAKLLMNMVLSCSKSSAREYLGVRSSSFDPTM